jgi:hypothetical protein
VPGGTVTAAEIGKFPLASGKRVTSAARAASGDSSAHATAAA